MAKLANVEKGHAVIVRDWCIVGSTWTVGPKTWVCPTPGFWLPPFEHVVETIDVGQVFEALVIVKARSQHVADLLTWGCPAKLCITGRGLNIQPGRGYQVRGMKLAVKSAEKISICVEPTKTEFRVMENTISDVRLYRAAIMKRLAEAARH